MNAKTALQHKKLIAERAKLLRKIQKLRDILPGSFAKSSTKCGKKNCRCFRGDTLHIVYRHTYSLRGKTYCKNISPKFRKPVQKQINDNKEFKQTLAKIYEVNLKLLNLQIEAD